jgi:hypothetical protein
MIFVLDNKHQLLDSGSTKTLIRRSSAEKLTKTFFHLGFPVRFVLDDAKTIIFQSRGMKIDFKTGKITTDIDPDKMWLI